MEAPVLIKPIPSQVVNELAAYGPFNLYEFIQAPDGSMVTFSGGLKDGSALPKGMICTSDGVLTGIPARNTQGNYEVKVTAQNEAGSIEADFLFTIKPSVVSATDIEYFDKLKAEVWEALDKHLPIPEIVELYNRPITAIDIYHLLERWGTLKIWDAFNLEAPGEPVLINLPNASPHFNVYDRGSCIIACPKDLFSQERTLEDGLQTARAVAEEIYKRNWTVELVGFDKYIRAAWVQLQILGDQHGKQLTIINFNPTTDDIKIYTTQFNHSQLASLEQ